MLHRLYEWYGKRVVLSVSALILVLIGVGIFILVTNKPTEEKLPEVTKATVEIKKVSDMSSDSVFSAVGTVEAVSEARLQTEAGGRVTSVTTEIGKSVSAGTILATLENSAERAVLLQAEGAYEAALAGAASSEIGVEGAKTGLDSVLTSGITTYQSTHITVDTILHNDIDDLFTVTNGKAIGFKINSQGQATTLNEERNALETIVLNWGLNKNSASKQSIETLLETARENTLRMAQFVDTLTAIVNDTDTSDSFSQTEKDTLAATLYASRLALNGTLQQIEAADVQISGAKRTLEQAQISGSSAQPSAASAQVKIALGSLRAAQANYEKTLVRTPISGTVNALYLKVGDYTTQGQQAAIVANNKGLEIKTSINEEDRTLINVGDTVVIDKLYKGIVTAIGGAIDPTTSKVAVNVSVENDTLLQNGSTVTLSFSANTTKTSSEVSVPLSALKMTGSGPIAFEVIDGNKLKAITVTLGTIKGETVLITQGLSNDSLIVVDARGLKEGQEVSVTQ